MYLSGHILHRVLKNVRQCNLVHPPDIERGLLKRKESSGLPNTTSSGVRIKPELKEKTQRRREICGLFTGRRELRDIGAGGGHPFGAVLSYARPQGFGQNGPFMPSSDFFRGCQTALAVNYYYKLTERVAIYLQYAFAQAFSTYYAKYTSALKTGVWETADPAPWLGSSSGPKRIASRNIQCPPYGPP
ncbi:hypothetical protein B0H14DRAFT_2565494 [Mycena olivaceomarginata]|nr:hypothetical protein B0H14DRAFT_2565494 [Mycena olivaceomarginata]